MAYFQRLILSTVLTVLSLFVVGPAQAAFPASGAGNTEYSIQFSAWYPSYQASCDTEGPELMASLHPGMGGRSYQLWGVECVGQGYEISSGGSYGWMHFGTASSRVSPGTCPANSSLSGGSCTCNAPLFENASHDGCMVNTSADTQCDASAALQNSTLGGGPQDVKLAGHVASGLVCAPAGGSGGLGCTADLDVTLRYGKGADEVTIGTLTQLSGEKQSCALTGPLDPAKPPTAPEKPCPTGQTGTLNGATVCIPFSPTTPVETDKKTKVDTKNPDGTPVSTETNSTTVCTGGSCSTTTTVTVNNNGTVTSTTSTTAAPKSDFCTQNPKDKQCGQLGSGAGQFGGACKAGFTCDGDAVMCAMATEQHQRDCALFETATAESDLYKTLTGKEGVQYKNDDVSIGIDRFD